MHLGANRQQFIIRSELMTVRSYESTRGAARELFFGFSGRGLYRLSLLLGVAFILLAAICPPSFSASINYGDFAGNTVTFIDVTESSDDPLPLYGAPTVSGDSLSFSPQQFLAKSEFGVPVSDTTDGQLTFMIKADGGQAVTNISFEEGGALSVTGLSTATNDTYVDVSAVGYVTVTEIDGVGVDPVAIPIGLIFDFGVGGNGTWRRVAEGSVSGFLWNGLQALDITQELIDRGKVVQIGATKLTINLDNILFAQSEPVGSARIDKKLFLEITTSTPIPEPSCLVLVSCGIVGFAMGLRRRGR
jgi:hypothetical protein